MKRRTLALILAAFPLSFAAACAKKEPPAPQPPPPRPGGVVGGVIGGVPAAPPQTPVRVGGNIREPQKTKQVPPRYPAEARAARVQGVVILETLIDKQGRVGDIHVLRSVPGLDEAAMEAVRQWEYTPTLLDGVPVEVIMTVTVNFSLQ